MFLLKQISSGNDVKSFIKGSVKLELLCYGLYRKGLITEEGGITLLGTALLDFLEESTTSETTTIQRVEIPDSCFADWWKAYPGTDTFTYKGKKFSGSRALRQKKDECKVKFNKILEEGTYTCDELIAALEYEVSQKKEASIKAETNRMMYMQNSLTYLNQRSFESFVELVKEGAKVEIAPSVAGGTDI
jgi:molybdopterin converting factor small subunit